MSPIFGNLKIINYKCRMVSMEMDCNVKKLASFSLVAWKNCFNMIIVCSLSWMRFSSRCSKNILSAKVSSQIFRTCLSKEANTRDVTSLSMAFAIVTIVDFSIFTTSVLVEAHE